MPEPVGHSWAFALAFKALPYVLGGLLSSPEGIVLSQPFGTLAGRPGDELAAAAAAVVAMASSARQAFSRSEQSEKPELFLVGISAGEHRVVIASRPDDGTIMVLLVEASVDLGMLRYELEAFQRRVPGQEWLKR